MSGSREEGEVVNLARAVCTLWYHNRDDEAIQKLFAWRDSHAREVARRACEEYEAPSYSPGEWTEETIARYAKEKKAAIDKAVSEAVDEAGGDVTLGGAGSEK